MEILRNYNFMLQNQSSERGILPNIWRHGQISISILEYSELEAQQQSPEHTENDFLYVFHNKEMSQKHINR